MVSKYAKKSFERTNSGTKSSLRSWSICSIVSVLQYGTEERRVEVRRVEERRVEERRGGRRGKESRVK